jgi:hypothetical protein
MWWLTEKRQVLERRLADCRSRAQVYSETVGRLFLKVGIDEVAGAHVKGHIAGALATIEIKCVNPNARLRRTLPKAFDFELPILLAMRPEARSTIELTDPTKEDKIRTL